MVTGRGAGYGGKEFETEYTRKIWMEENCGERQSSQSNVEPAKK